ncbi:potassium-transporting ATPase subunit C, partial [Salmonella enterica subsp. enterica serovar Virginia]|nr:potassium-transporting ATPase subunit C [Salmonella enterica subsp. enterica serovar Virginia]
LTPGAAAWQIPRVAAARQLPVEQVAQLVAEYTHRPLARFLGQDYAKKAIFGNTIRRNSQ